MKPDTPFARLTRDRLLPHHQKLWDGAQKLHGDSTFVEVFGHAPQVLDWYLQDFYARLFYSGRIDRRLVELVRLRLANIHGCAFCNRSDRIAALDAGVPEAQIDALADYENGPFSEKEKAALALADVMVLTNPKGYVTKALYQRARAHFTDGEMVELGVMMAVLCGMAKLIFAYDLVEKEDYCPFIPERQAAE
jgi:AhpD family alkylhydroperoxidase